MIYTVTFNPALDYILTLDELQTKDINRAKTEALRYGGKGINVSAILTQLGVETVALGFLAGFSGEKVADLLKAENIRTDFVSLSQGYTRINVKIKAQAQFDINAPGPEIGQADIAALLAKLSALQDGDTLVLAGSIPAALPDDMYEKMLERLRTKQIRFAVDATGELLLNVLPYKPFLIKPNHHELGELFSTEVKTLAEIRQYATELQQRGAQNVLVSRGKDGAALLDANGVFHTVGNVPGKPVNPVGCGDSMVAGFLAGYAATKQYAAALRLGAACGNATAFCEGLASRAEIDKMLQSEYLHVTSREG